MKLVVATAVCMAAQGMRVERRSKTQTKDCYSMYDGKVLVHLAPCNSYDVGKLNLKLEKLGCKLLDDEFALPKSGGCAQAEAICSDDAAAELMVSKLVGITSNDAGAYYRNISGVAHSYHSGEVGIESGIKSVFYRKWRDYDARMARVEELVKASGGIATIETSGTSTEGRAIKLVRFTGQGYTSGGPKVFLTFNLHAREWVGGMSGIYAIEKLVEKVQSNPSYLNGVEVLMMPMANPDGFIRSSVADRMHRKNMRVVGNGCFGVDVNRNFDAHWAQGGSSNDRCSDTYHGTNSMTEPETNIIANIMKESSMTVYIDVHAYSKLILTSYGWTTADHPRKAEYAAIAGLIGQAIKSKHGESYKEGPIAQELYVASGSSVDYADDLGALGLCIELRPGARGGGGFAPPASEILPTAEECFEGILASIQFAIDPTMTPPPTPAPIAPKCPYSWCSSYCYYGGCSGCIDCI